MISGSNSAISAGKVPAGAGLPSGQGLPKGSDLPGLPALPGLASPRSLKAAPNPGTPRPSMDMAALLDEGVLAKVHGGRAEPVAAPTIGRNFGYGAGNAPLDKGGAPFDDPLYAQSDAQLDAQLDARSDAAPDTTTVSPADASPIAQLNPAANVSPIADASLGQFPMTRPIIDIRAKLEFASTPPVLVSALVPALRGQAEGAEPIADANWPAKGSQDRPVQMPPQTETLAAAGVPDVAAVVPVQAGQVDKARPAGMPRDPAAAGALPAHEPAAPDAADRRARGEPAVAPQGGKALQAGKDMPEAKAAQAVPAAKAAQSGPEAAKPLPQAPAAVQLAALPKGTQRPDNGAASLKRSVLNTPAPDILPQLTRAPQQEHQQQFDPTRQQAAPPLAGIKAAEPAYEAQLRPLPKTRTDPAKLTAAPRLAEAQPSHDPIAERPGAALTPAASAHAAANPSVSAPTGAAAAPSFSAVPAPDKATAPQIEQAIDQLTQTREASRSARPELTVRHAEFGAVNMRLEGSGADLRAVLTNRDPGFIPAIHAALADRAVIAAVETTSHAGNQPGSRQQENSQNGANNGAQSGAHNAGSGGSAAGGNPRYGSFLGEEGSGSQPSLEHLDADRQDSLLRGGGGADGPADGKRNGGLFA